MNCSTLFPHVHRERERESETGIDVDLQEWVIVNETAGSYLVEPCCESSELFICKPCVCRGRKVEALGGRKEEKEGGY